MDDLISRQAAIAEIHEDADWLAAQGSDWQTERMERDKSILMSLPSVEPDTNCSEIPNNSDTISRQQAIDALRNYLVEKRCPDDGTLTCRLIENEVINKLPSVQPEQRWIPVSERLPEDGDYKPFSYYEDGAVLFCTKDDKIGFGWCYESTKQWANEDDKSPGEVIAWMPLPEPYQEGGE